MALPHVAARVLALVTFAGVSVGGCGTAPLAPPTSMRAPDPPRAKGPCEDFELDVKRVWSSQTKADVKAGIIEVGGEWGQAVSLEVTTKLDALSRGWVMMKQSACRDHLIRKVLPAEAYNRISSCLNTVLVDQGTLLAIAHSPSRDAIAQMNETLRAIGDELQSCGSRALDETYEAAADFSKADAAGQQVTETPDQRVRDLLAQARTLRALVQYDDAKVTAEKALALAKEHGLARLQVNALIHLASIENRLGHYSGSEYLARQAVRKAEAESSSEELFSAVLALGDAQMSQAKFRGAEASAERARALAKVGSEDAANAGYLLGRIYSDQGKYAQALAMYREALQIDRELFGDDHPDVGTIYNNIAVVYDGQGDSVQALAMYRKALDIHLQAVGPNHPGIAAAYNNIGVVHRRQREYALALEAHNKALDIKRKTLGEGHPATAASYSNIGLVYESQGDHARAITLYQKALEIERETLGEEHPDTAISYGNLASAYDEQGDYVVALALYKKALEIKRRALGDKHPSTSISYNNIGLVYEHQGDSAKALAMYRKAAAIDREVLGENHPEAAAPYYNMARVYNDQRDYVRALPLYRKALEIERTTLGEDHPDTVATREDVKRLCDTGFRPACD
jgi:tetratricopeptide (TPR) repeat protein